MFRFVSKWMANILWNTEQETVGARRRTSTPFHSAGAILCKSGLLLYEPDIFLPWESAFIAAAGTTVVPIGELWLLICLGH